MKSGQTTQKMTRKQTTNEKEYASETNAIINFVRLHSFGRSSSLLLHLMQKIESTVDGKNNSNNNKQTKYDKD